MSLPRSRILRARVHFARVRAEGQAKPGRFLLLTAQPTGEHPEAPSLFGFITPKYVGKAHDRNLVRRRLRAIVRADTARLPTGHHIVVLARRAVMQASFAQLQAEWRKLAAKAGVLAPPPASVPGKGANRC